jgi:DNA-binding NarL/FixJ family response regulator
VQALDDFLPAAPTAGASSIDDLTAREREVLEIIAQGRDNSEIAALLRISQKTVRNHVSIILGKLGIRSRAKAIVLARDAGLGRRMIP